MPERPNPAAPAAAASDQATWQDSLDKPLRHVHKLCFTHTPTRLQRFERPPHSASAHTTACTCTQTRSRFPVFAGPILGPCAEQLPQPVWVQIKHCVRNSQDGTRQHKPATATTRCGQHTRWWSAHRERSKQHPVSQQHGLQPEHCSWHRCSHAQRDHAHAHAHAHTHIQLHCKLLGSHMHSGS